MMDMEVDAVITMLGMMDVGPPKYKSFEEYRGYYPHDTQCRLFFVGHDKQTYVFYQLSTNDAYVIHMFDGETTKFEMMGHVLLFPELETAVVSGITYKLQTMDAVTYRSHTETGGIHGYKKVSRSWEMNLKQMLQKFMGPSYKIHIGYRQCLQKSLRKRLMHVMKRTFDSTAVPRDCYAHIASLANPWLDKQPRSKMSRQDFAAAHNIYCYVMHCAYTPLEVQCFSDTTMM